MPFTIRCYRYLNTEKIKVLRNVGADSDMKKTKTNDSEYGTFLDKN